MKILGGKLTRDWTLIIIQNLLRARHCGTQVSYIISFSPHSFLVRPINGLKTLQSLRRGCGLKTGYQEVEGGGLGNGKFKIARETNAYNFPQKKRLLTTGVGDTLKTRKTALIKRNIERSWVSIANLAASELFSLDLFKINALEPYFCSDFENQPWLLVNMGLIQSPLFLI